MEQHNKESNFISAVVYLCDDAARIVPFIEGLDRTLSEVFRDYEIIVVNDASDDDGVARVREYAHSVNSGEKEHSITVLNMSYRQGPEASMNAGLNLAIGDFVFEFDSLDDDYPWSMLTEVYRHALSGFDIVSARGDRPVRMLSRLYYRLFNRFAHLQHPLGPETFRLLSRRAINRIHSISQSIPYRKAAYANCGLAADTLTYKPLHPVQRRKNKFRATVAVESLLLYTDVPFRATMLLALCMFLISMGVGIYAVIYKLLSNPVAGWTTTIFFISFGFSGLFLILSMVIRYMQTLVRLNFRKKDYQFESIEKLQ